MHLLNALDQDIEIVIRRKAACPPTRKYCCGNRRTPSAASQSRHTFVSRTCGRALLLFR
jgi:hypothetical protein